MVEDLDGAGAAARQAGLQPGDVVIAVDGQPVDYVSQLQEKVAFRRAGETVALEVARKGGARATVRVPLQAVRDRTADAGPAGRHRPVLGANALAMTRASRFRAITMKIRTRAADQARAMEGSAAVGEVGDTI